jgi:hypothetical protein
MKDMTKRLVAETIGTFCLVFAGTGAITINDVSGGQVTHVGIALTFGLVVMAMIYAIGDVSGAHLNPAVTLGFWVARRFSGSHVLPYVLSQIAGAVGASLLLRLMFPLHDTRLAAASGLPSCRTLIPADATPLVDFPPPDLAPIELQKGGEPTKVLATYSVLIGRTEHLLVRLDAGIHSPRPGLGQSWHRREGEDRKRHYGHKSLLHNQLLSKCGSIAAGLEEVYGLDLPLI